MSDSYRSRKEMGCLFCKCLEAFSTQNPRHFLELPELFFKREGERWKLNRNHPFWKDYPAAGWAMDAIAYEFLLHIQRIDGEPSSLAWQEMRKHIGLRLQDQLTSVIRGIDLDIITAISGEKYESASSMGMSLTLFPYPLNESDIRALDKDAVLLKKEMWIRLSLKNIHALRKQLNLAKDASLAICFFSGEDIEEGLYLVGFVSPETGTRFPRIYYTGHMEWMFCLPSPDFEEEGITWENAILTSCRLRYYQGRQFLPILETKRSDEKKISEALKGEGEDRRRKVSSIVQDARVCVKKGGIIIFMDHLALKNECERLCKDKKRGMLLGKKVGLEHNRGAIQRFASVDGAIFADLDGNCYAYGVILDGEAVIEGSMARGARFNSTRNYMTVLKRKYPQDSMIGVVLSEDGMVNLFSGCDGAKELPDPSCALCINI